MHSTQMAWARGLYLAGMVLALVLVVPTVWGPFQLAKITAFAVCLAASALLFVWAGGARELWRAHGLRGALLVGLLPLAYGLSLLTSTDMSVGVSGYAIEVDTLLFAAVSFITFMLGFVYFRTLRTARTLIVTLGVALGAAAIFQAINVIFGSSAIPFATFADRSANLVGKWNDLGLLLGLLGVFLLVWTQFGAISGRVRMLLTTIMVVLAAMLALVNFALVWVLVLIGALAVALVSFLSARAAGEARMRNSLPKLPLAAAGVAILFLIWGSTFNLQLTSVLPVSSLEVRPGYQTTFEVENAARSSSVARLLVGTGPNTFGQQWLMHKPAEVNQSQFWNLDFNVGFSTILTAFGTVGLVGAIAWLLPAILVLIAMLRVVRLRLLTQSDRAAALCLVLSSLFLTGAMLFYVPSANLVLLMVGLSGAAFGFLYRQGQETPQADLSRLAHMGALFLVVIVVALAVWGSVVSVRRLVAEGYVARSSAALVAGSADEAVRLADKAVGVEKTGDTLRLMVLAGAGKLQTIAADTTSTPSTLQQQFSATLDKVLAAGLEAQKLNPQDYRPVMMLAQVYDLLAQLNVAGADVQARAAYDAAAALNPTSPQIPLLRARLEAVKGNGEDTQKYLQQSLTLKPNYTDAMLLVTQIAVANNDLQTALQAAQAAVQSAPGVPSLWFQFGLLLYAGGDTQNAIPVLEQALSLQGDYANAQYFLGLSYYAQNRAQDAIRLFENLMRINPDNTEVALILNNMRAGKPAFDGATPPSTTPPEDRTTAPVAQ